jgi:hypothetical protein
MIPPVAIWLPLKRRELRDSGSYILLSLACANLLKIRERGSRDGEAEESAGLEAPAVNRGVHLGESGARSTA